MGFAFGGIAQVLAGHLHQQLIDNEIKTNRSRRFDNQALIAESGPQSCGNKVHGSADIGQAAGRLIIEKNDDLRRLPRVLPANSSRNTPGVDAWRLIAEIRVKVGDDRLLGATAEE